jgi:hypothetical protein
MESKNRRSQRVTLDQNGLAIHTQGPLSERENERAVDTIERAERLAPYCTCGRHMLAVAEGSVIWLECSSLIEPKVGIRARLAWLTALNHKRQKIMELPVAS